jgi:hypothetical protein
MEWVLNEVEVSQSVVVNTSVSHLESPPVLSNDGHNCIAGDGRFGVHPPSQPASDNVESTHTIGSPSLSQSSIGDCQPSRIDNESSDSIGLAQPAVLADKSLNHGNDPVNSTNDVVGASNHQPLYLSSLSLDECKLVFEEIRKFGTAKDAKFFKRAFYRLIPACRNNTN